MVTRRKFLSFSALTGAALLARPQMAFASHTGYTVGAIRWDPWYITTDTAERPQVESTLGPSKFQSRAPSCATIVNTYTASYANCGTQTQIDAEITVSAAAKIDYWAYCWYSPTDPMQTAWRFHQSSSIKNNINWCLLFSGWANFESETTASMSTYVGYLQQSNYQKVLTTKPLVYILSDGTSASALTTAITAFRSACTAQSITPYIVLMGGAATAASVGADAVSVYAYSPSAGVVAGSYPTLVTAAEAEWTALKATGQPMVPTAMTGWDRRPRIERPLPWEPFQLPFVGDSNYYAAGTPAQIAAHVADMLTFLAGNAAACPAATGLIYAWDEHDEGGSALAPELGGGGAILSAVAGVL